MNKQNLAYELENLGTAARINRERVCDLVIENPILFPQLLTLFFEKDNKLSIKAAWVLEFVLNKNLDWLTPHLNFFTQNLSTLHLGSAVRPAAKICEFIAKAYTSKKDSIIKSKLTEKQINLIIETGFDWMISQHKVAVKAYTMKTLHLFGNKSDWIHEELKLIIQQNILTESPAYKARGKMILALINKK